MCEKQEKSGTMSEAEKRAAQEKGKATRMRRWQERQAKKAAEQKKREEEEEWQKRTDEEFMREALRQAKQAAALGDVPIGCVIVQKGKILSSGYNRRNADKTVLSHAEILAISRACEKTGDWRLEDCTIYITLEPCPMCAGAIVQARIPTVVIGSRNPKAGCAGSVMDVLGEQGFNHRTAVRTGVCEEACSQLLSEFFSELRKRGGGEDFSPKADR